MLEITSFKSSVLAMMIYTTALRSFGGGSVYGGVGGDIPTDKVQISLYSRKTI